MSTTNVESLVDSMMDTITHAADCYHAHHVMQWLSQNDIAMESFYTWLTAKDSVLDAAELAGIEPNIGIVRENVVSAMEGLTEYIKKPDVQKKLLFIALSGLAQRAKEREASEDGSTKEV